MRYAVRLARASRPGANGSLDFVSRWVKWGAGPRAGQYLILGAKAAALFKGRFHASCEDVRQVASAVLRHRILVNYRAEAEGMTTGKVIEQLLETVPPEVH